MTYTTTASTTSPSPSSSPPPYYQDGIIYQVGPATYDKDNQIRTLYEYHEPKEYTHASSDSASPVSRDGRHSVPPEDDGITEFMIRQYFLASYYAKTKTIDGPISGYDWDADECYEPKKYTHASSDSASPASRDGRHSVPPEDDGITEVMIRQYFLASYYAKTIDRPISRYDWDADEDEIIVPCGGVMRETYMNWSY